MQPGNKRILLVEDDPSLRSEVRQDLEQLDLEVHAVASGRAALQALDGQHFDLICLEMTLPDLSGLEVCDFVRRAPHLARVPVVVLSARALPLDRALAEDSGASAFVPKPFATRDLTAAVSAALDLDGGEAAVQPGAAAQLQAG